MNKPLKVRFLEPGNRPYRPSPWNLFVYDRYIRTPGTGLITLATIARDAGADARVYSESISRIVWEDVLDADLVCIGVFTFNAPRGYALADYVRKHSRALVVLGGLHASLSAQEAVGHADFVLLGEALGGDYNQWMGPDKCHSVTNYDCFKGLWSSFNDRNLFEIGHSLARQYGPEPWTLYKGAHLLSFADNHDVTRLASKLTEPRHIPLAYAILMGMPGTPALYYGSEWGIKGEKGACSDDELRPALEQPEWNDLTDWIAKLAAARRNSPALCNGSYRNVLLTNRQIIFERKVEGERVLVAVNADGEPYVAHFDAGCGLAWDLITGEQHDFGGGSELPPYSAYYWKMER